MSANVIDDFLKEVVSEYYEEELYAKDKTDELVPSDEFRENMDRLIKAVDNKSRNKKKRVVRLKWAACVASVLIIASVVVGLNKDVQAGGLDFIKSLFAGGFDGDETVEDSNNIDNIVDFNIKYIPEGYEFISRKKTDMITTYEYTKGNYRLEFVYYENNSNMYTFFDNEYRKHDIVRLDDGTMCDYYIDNIYTSESNLIWKRGKYVCYLVKDSVNSECDLLKIANSITPEYEYKNNDAKN